MSTNKELARKLGLPLDTITDKLYRIREARVYGLPDTATWLEVRRERLRRQMISILPELEEDASWLDIYCALCKTQIPELKACLKASEWWLKKVKQTRRTGPTFPEEIAPMFVGLPLGDSGTTTPEEDIIFMSFLVYDGAWYLIHRGDRYPRVSIDTDYHPDGTLEEAGELVGIGSSSFPVKCHTVISRDSVVVYKSGQSEEIYKAEVDRDFVTPDIFKEAKNWFDEIYYQGKYDDIQPVQKVKSKKLKKTTE